MLWRQRSSRQPGSRGLQGSCHRGRRRRLVGAKTDDARTSSSAISHATRPSCGSLPARGWGQGTVIDCITCPEVDAAQRSACRHKGRFDALRPLASKRGTNAQRGRRRDQTTQSCAPSSRWTTRSSCPTQASLWLGGGTEHRLQAIEGVRRQETVGMPQHVTSHVHSQQAAVTGRTTVPSRPDTDTELRTACGSLLAKVHQVRRRRACRDLAATRPLWASVWDESQLQR